MLILLFLPLRMGCLKNKYDQPNDKKYRDDRHSNALAIISSGQGPT